VQQGTGEHQGSGWRGSRVLRGAGACQRCVNVLLCAGVFAGHEMLRLLLHVQSWEGCWQLEGRIARQGRWGQQQPTGAGARKKQV
jgi:hypothetical protein